MTKLGPYGMTLQECADVLNREEGTNLSAADVFYIERCALRKMRAEFERLGLSLDDLLPSRKDWPTLECLTPAATLPDWVDDLPEDAVFCPEQCCGEDTL